MKCPICKKPVADPEEGKLRPFYPFCSDRCKLIDLGRWLDGKYQIPVEEPPQYTTGNESTDESDD